MLWRKGNYIGTSFVGGGGVPADSCFHCYVYRCNGKKTCVVNTDAFRNPDPCDGTFKYLQTNFTCLPASRSPLWNCVTSKMHIILYRMFFRLNSYRGGMWGVFGTFVLWWEKAFFFFPRWIPGHDDALEMNFYSVFTVAYVEFFCCCFILRTRNSINNLLSLTLMPDVGQVISVYGADYGRRDRTTCSYKRPENQIQNVDCLRPTELVASRYDGTHVLIMSGSWSRISARAFLCGIYLLASLFFWASQFISTWG